ncbi:preprotein translocase subunit SecG [bacterium]|nr:preprotein translocase subunit SecG [bacterium]
MLVLINILQLISALVLIFLVAIQTTKREAGISGAIGGKITTPFKLKPGYEEWLDKLTMWAAIIFFALSIVVATIYMRMK